MSELARGTRIEVTTFAETHAAAVSEFFAQVWDPAATRDSVWQSRQRTIGSNPFQPGEDVPTSLFLRDGKVLGYVTTIPVALWTGQGERPAFWVKGLMVLPEHRSGPIGYYVLKHLITQTPCALSLTVASASRRLFSSLGFRELGLLSNHLRVLRPGSMAQRLNLANFSLTRIPRWVPPMVTAAQKTGIAYLGGMLGGAALNAVTALRGPHFSGMQIDYPDTWPAADEIEALWNRMRSRLRCSITRDSRYLPWRYDVGGSARYGLVIVRAKGELTGLAVVRRPSAKGDPRLTGIRLSVLSELLWDPAWPGSMSLLLKGAGRRALQFEADAIMCSTSNSSLRRALAGAGYLPIPGNLHFLWYDKAGDYDLAAGLEDWWLMRGDMEADEVF